MSTPVDAAQLTEKSCLRLSDMRWLRRSLRATTWAGRLYSTER